MSMFTGLDKYCKKPSNQVRDISSTSRSGKFNEKKNTIIWINLFSTAKFEKGMKIAE